MNINDDVHGLIKSADRAKQSRNGILICAKLQLNSFMWDAA